MNKLKMLCLALVLTLLLPYICYAQESTGQAEISSEDVTSTTPLFDNADEWALTELKQAYEFGLTTVKSTQKMSSSITREEFCELAVLFYEKYMEKAAAIPAVNPFTDTASPTILKAVGLGITNGITPTSFTPAGLISKQDMAVMIVRAMKACGIDTSVTTGVTAFMDAKNIGSYALSSVEALQERGVLKGEKVDSFGGKDRYKLNPLSSISKQEAVILLKRTFEYSCMVRNASKWGPEVYIPKINPGDVYLYSKDELFFENDLFDLKIAAGTPVEKKFEKRVYNILKYIEIESGFSPNYNSTKKWLITADLKNSYNTGYNWNKYSRYFAFNYTSFSSPVPDDAYENQDIINSMFYQVLGNYTFDDKVPINNTLVNAMKKYTIIKIQENNFYSGDYPLYRYLQGFNNIEIERFETELAQDPEIFFNNLNNMKTMSIYDEEFLPEMYFYSNAYYLLFSYINETYGKDTLHLCFSDIANATKTAYIDFDNLIYKLKSRTNKKLFNDFNLWYKQNKQDYNISDSDYVAGITEPIYNKVSEVGIYHPNYMSKSYDYPYYNIIRYLPPVDYCNNFEFVDDTLIIDYTSAIAIAQINGFEIKGISLSYSQMKKYTSQGLTYEVYDANGDLIFKGPTEKLFANIDLNNGYLFLYGGVKVVLHAKPGTQIRYKDGADVTSQLLVKQ